jgi:nucleoside-diphosphate-sugar epimerase
VRVAVTGAQGLIGRQLVSAALDGGAAAVLGLGRSPRVDDRFTHDLEWLGARVPAPLPADLRRSARDRRYTYERVDLGDVEGVSAVARRFRPDVVIHAAAALRDEAWEALVASNMTALFGLVRGFAAAPSRPRIVLTSTGSVYGAARGQLPFEEDGPTEPIEPYGATKRAGEDVARILAAETGTRLTIGRVFNVVGPGLQDRHLPGRLASLIAAIARGLAPPVLTLGPLDATRDFIDSRDTAAALLALASAQDPPALVNIGSGNETPAQLVLDLMLDVADVSDVQIERIEGRRSDVARAFADVRRLHALTFAPRYELRDTLRDMVSYFDAFSAA